MSHTTRRSLAGSSHGSKTRGGQAGLVLLYSDALPQLTNVHLLRGERLRLGRDAGVELRVEHETVSRSHAELVHTAEGWQLLDLGSSNGTLVDGFRVRAAPLAHGSIVRFGDVIFKVVLGDAELMAAYLPDGGMRGSAVRLGPRDSALVGGFQIDRVAARLAKVAASDLSLLLLGESGTGKEVAASEVHRLSGRSGRFYATNCAAIPSNLLESELFGYKKGAFSGAVRDKPGLFQAAHRGTLLLDEIGDMPADSQAKLLRALQSGEITPLGSVEPVKVDVRILAATHQDLDERQSDGRFRRDLFARLSELVIELPPLRDRKEDIFPLCRAFAQKHGAAEVGFSVGFMAALLHYDWPYNVRELESCIKRSITLADDQLLQRRLLPDVIRAASAGYGEAPEHGLPSLRPSRPPATPLVDEHRLRTLLDLHQGNISAIARDLGKARMQIHRWLSHYGIDVAGYRDGQGRDKA